MTIESLVAVISASVGGGGAWGLMRYMNHKKNGNNPVRTEKECNIRHEGLDHRFDAVEKGIDEIKSILLRGTMECGSRKDQ